MVGIINKFVVLLLPFLVRTAFIYSLGAEYLGLNSLFTSILTVLSMTELGFSSAIVFSMYEPIASDDEDTICALLKFYRKVYRVIGLVILGIGICILPFLPNLINGEEPAGLNIYVLYLLYLANTVISYLLFAYKKSILEAFQRNDILSIVDTITVGLTNVVQFVMLIIYQDARIYYFYVITLLLLTVVNNIINAVIINRKYPQYKCVGNLSKKKLTVIKKQVSGLVVNKMCQISRNSFDSIFVSAFISLTMTTMYNNYYFVLNAVVGIMNVFTNAMLAGIGNSITTETVEKNYNDFNKFNFMYMWISSWAAITMFCLYENFMVLWVGQVLTLDLWISLLFSLYFYILKIGDIRATYSSAAGLWWENRRRAMVEVVVNIILNYLFVRVWGVYGIITATIIPLLLINNTIGAKILYRHYFVGGNLKNYFMNNVQYFAVGIVAGMVTYFICSWFTGGVLGLLGRACICIIIPNLIFVLLYRHNVYFVDAKKWVLMKLIVADQMGEK